MIKILQHELCRCLKCEDEFTPKNAPYILTCGNTLCKKCAEKLIDKRENCFFDEKHTHKEGEAYENLAFKSIVEKIQEQVKNIQINKQKMEEEQQKFIKEREELQKKLGIKNDEYLKSNLIKIQLNNKIINSQPGRIISSNYVDIQKKPGGSLNYNIKNIDKDEIYKGKYVNGKK